WPAPPGGRPGDARPPAPRSPTSPTTCSSPPASPPRPQNADLPGCGRGAGGGLRHTRRMRVYLPVTLTELTDPEGLSGREARALTRSLRAALGPDADSDTGEYAALVLAAEDSLHRLGEQDPARRVVAAADVPDAQVHAGEQVARVSWPAGVWSQVVSFHADVTDGGLDGLESAAQREEQSGQAPVEDREPAWCEGSE